MTSYFKICVSSILTILVISSCTHPKTTFEYANNKIWVYGNGVRFNNIDIINLTPNVNLLYRNDSLFLNKSPFAVIISLDTIEAEMVLQSTSSDSTGTYFHIEKFSQ
jgi:hypothetical protein